jgi:hypothetical protein
MASLPTGGYILGTVPYFAPEALQVRRTAVVRKFARSLNTKAFHRTNPHLYGVPVFTDDVASSNYPVFKEIELASTEIEVDQ